MKVMVVAPHPDDETLGCGGTLLKHKAAGDEIYWLIMTNISGEEGYDEKKVQDRQQEIEMVAGEYGFEYIFKLDFPTTKLDIIPRNKLINSISKVIDRVKPEIIYLPNRNDIHSDHKITFDTAISSVKTFRCPFIRKLLMYEVVSETEFTPPLQNNSFIPNSFSDISKFMDKKISIMNLYKGEMREYPFPRSVENLKALATFRGATAGIRYVEAFMMIKDIW